MAQFNRPSLLLLLSSLCWSAPPQPHLGSVEETADACQASPPPNMTCRHLKVSCEGLRPIQAEIRIMEPAAGVAPRGTVVLGSGGNGAAFYAGPPEVQALVRDLAAMGFRVIDRRWIGGWTTNEGGLKKEACRYSTLLTWVHDHLHKGGKFVATGNSGGSAEIGYALTSWGRGDILDLAIPSSGPPTARLDYVCVKEASAEWAALCAGIIPRGVMECASTCLLGPSNGVCTQVSAQPTPEQLLADSVVNSDAVLNYPKTRVHFLFGAHDCGEPVPVGLTWATKMTSEKKIEFVPKTPHPIFSTPEGREAIRKAIDLGTAAK
jgi:hypothetical protein